MVDETIHLRADGPRAGNILTTRHFADFDLHFEWKIAAKGNSGVKYRVQKFGDQVLGCEYQILDDAGYPGLQANQWTGSLYDLYAPTSSPTKSALEFNHSRIVVSGNHIQHWFNGELVVQAVVRSSDWRARKASSKFTDVEGFGENRWGRIMLTDHNSEVWYRNLTLRPLEEPACGLLLAGRPTVLRICNTARSCATPCRPANRLFRCRPICRLRCCCGAR